MKIRKLIETLRGSPDVMADDEIRCGTLGFHVYRNGTRIAYIDETSSEIDLITCGAADEDHLPPQWYCSKVIGHTGLCGEES